MKKKHILIAEDEAQTRFTLTLLLKNEGYEVTAVSDGEEALDAIEAAFESGEMPFDLLVMDIQMPRVTGLELLDRLRHRRIQIPTLVITGYGSKDLVVELMRKGCADYLDKPFQPEELLSRVFQVIQREEKSRLQQRKVRGEKQKEVTDLGRIIEDYRDNLEKLRKDVDTAVIEYQGLTGIDPDSLCLPVSLFNRPLRELGGDFVHIQNTGAGCLFFVADVSGHDMGASFHTLLMKHFFDDKASFAGGCDGREIMARLNNSLLEGSRQKRMVTACLLDIDLKRMEARFFGAAAPPAFRIPRNAFLAEMLPSGGSPLGVNRDPVLFDHTFSIEEGDRIFLYTDGVAGAHQIDGLTGKKRKLQEKGVVTFVEAYASLPLAELMDNFRRDLLRFCRFKPCDDMFFLALEIIRGRCGDEF